MLILTYHNTMQIKGLISLKDNLSFTCCESRSNIHIDEKSLHEFLLNKAKLGEVPEDYGRTIGTKIWKIRYVIRDTPFKKGESFESIVIPIITGSLESEHIYGCYSEWTCGRGDIDFVLKGSHSILTELASHIGKYVWIKFD